MLVFILFVLIMLSVLVSAVYDTFKIPTTLKYIMITILFVIIILGLCYLLFITACYLVSFNVSRETFLEMVRYYPSYL